jgi:hypothetical protein
MAQIPHDTIGLIFVFIDFYLRTDCIFPIFNNWVVLSIYHAICGKSVGGVELPMGKLNALHIGRMAEFESGTAFENTPPDPCRGRTPCWRIAAVFAGRALNG